MDIWTNSGLIALIEKNGRGIKLVVNEIRYNGVYQYLDRNNKPEYLRFFSNGLVVHTDSNMPPEEIWKWLGKDVAEQGSYERSGNGNQIDFAIRDVTGRYNPEWALIITGVILEDAMRLDLHNLAIGSTQKDLRFIFIPLE